MNKKKLALTGIIACSALMVASLSFTVAWYNGSSHLGLSDITISFSSPELTISKDDETFKDRLLASDLDEVRKFTPVTTAFSNEWMAAKKAKPTFYSSFYEPKSEFMTSSSDLSVAKSGYLSQELYLKSTIDTHVTIDPSETKITANHAKNVAKAKQLKKSRDAYKNLSEEEIVRRLDSVEDSLRISVLVLNEHGSSEFDEYEYYIVNPKKEAVTKYGGILNTGDTEYYDSFGGKEILYGQFDVLDKANLLYDQASSQDSSLEENKVPNAFVAKTKAGIQHLDLSKQDPSVLKAAEENAIALEDVEGKMQISLRGGVSRKVVFSLYMEGWDLDNTDFAKYSHFSMNLSWKIQRTV